MTAVQEIGALRGQLAEAAAAKSAAEESLAKATSAHKESLSALTREREWLQEELSRTKTTSVRRQGCRCVRYLCVL